MTVFRMLLAVFASRIALALVGAVALLAMADMAETSRQLAEQDDPLRLLLIVYGNLLPSLTLQALPIAVLLGVLLALTDLARSRELLALRAAGASASRLALPALSIAALLAMVGLMIADHVAPVGVARATRVQMEELGRMRASWSPFHSRHSWFASGSGGLYNVGEVSSEGATLAEVWRYEHRGGRMTEISFTESVVHDGDDWSTSGLLRVWSLDPDDGKVVRLHRELAPIDSPARFAGVVHDRQTLIISIFGRPILQPLCGRDSARPSIAGRRVFSEHGGRPALAAVWGMGFGKSPSAVPGGPILIPCTAFSRAE